MKAIVLAGGHATRLWPLTRHRAKPLLPLAGKPIVQYTMDQLAEIDAVSDTIIATNAKHAADFRAFVDEHGYDARVLVEDHRREVDKEGTLGAIMQVIEAEGADDYLVIGGDNYPAFDLSRFVALAREQETILVACHEVEDEAAACQFGVVEVDEQNRVTGFEEKPAEPASLLVSTAFYFFPAQELSIFQDYVDAFADADADYLDEPGRLIEWGHTRYDMGVFSFDGEWHDIGTPENYLQAQARLADDGARHGTVTDSDIGPNVWVMDGAEVVDSTLKNCIIFPDAEIRGSSLDGCIVDEEVVVRGKSLTESVIGAYSSVR